MKRSLSALPIVAGALLAVGLLAPDAVHAVVTWHSDHSVSMLIADTGTVVGLKEFKELTDKVVDVTAKFNAKSDELTKSAEAAMKEVKDKGALIEQTKAAIDKLLVDHTALAGEKNKITAKRT